MDFCDFSELCASAPYVMPDDLDVAAFLDDRLWAPLSPLPAFAALATTQVVYTTTATTSNNNSHDQEPHVPPQAEPVHEPRFSPYGPDIYNVECIVKHKNRPSGRTYLVKWEGWPSNYNSWVKREDFCTDDLPAAYEQALREQREEARRYQQQQQRRKRTFDAAATTTLNRPERACKRRRTTTAPATAA